MKGLEKVLHTVKKEEKEDLIKIVLLSLIPILLILFGLFANIDKGITSYTTVSTETSHEDDLYLVFDEASEYEWLLENRGELKSVRLSGSLSDDAIAKVYIENGDDRYLVFDSLRLEDDGLSDLTGLVILDMQEETINKIDSVINEPLENLSITNNNKINEKSIILNLNYEENSNYDDDNDGVETLAGVVDFSVDAEFDWDVNYDKLCTKWDVYSVENEESTIVCYGSSECCSLLDLAPEKTVWDEIFYLNYGRYGATNNNIVAAQIIYADYSLDPENPYSDIVYSDYESLTAEFSSVDKEFENICLDTCLLSGFDSDDYKLIIEVSKGTLSMNTIRYEVIAEETIGEGIVGEEVVERKDMVVVGKPVRWTKNVKLSKSGKLTVDVPEKAYNLNVNKVKDGVKERLASVKEKKAAGFAIAQEKPTKEIIIEEDVEEVEVEYETPGPEAVEEDINKHKKRITISSDIHYTDILANTNLPTEVNKESIKLYWVIGNSKQIVEFDAYDNNDNGLIDYIEWKVPSLSSQTYELEITILNVQSYPIVGGEWTVMFNTTGTGDLSIKASNGTAWSNTNEDNDLKFLDIKCGEEILDYSWVNNEVFIENYNCPSLGYHTVKVLTEGVHIQEFDFAGIIAYANNLASINGSKANLTIWDSTDSELINYDAPITFYANYTNTTSGNTLNGSDFNCTFSENSTGSWTTPINITFNNTIEAYVYNKSFARVNVSYFNMSCIDKTGGYNNLSLVDSYQVGWANLSINLGTNVTTNGTNVTIYGHINLSDSSNATNNDISIYVNGTKLFYDSDARLLVATGSSTSPETDSYGDYNYTFKSPGDDGSFEIVVNLTYSGIYAALSVNMTVDATEPNVSLDAPINDFNTTSSSIIFNWTVTDNIDTNMTCNLTINNEINASDIIANNGTRTNYTVSGINEGTYLWNVTCVDNSTNTNTSQTWAFAVDTSSPAINLDLPFNNTWQKQGNVTFKYTATDARGIDFCTLYGDFNGSLWRANYTDTSVDTGVQGTFNLNLTNGTYLWNVWCNDTLGNIAFNATNFTVGVDTVLPNITYDVNTETNNSYFNRTWIFISIDGNDTNEANVTFMLVNSTDVVNETTLLEDDNRSFNFTNLNSNEVYYYNVTIKDKAENENKTETRTITLDSSVPSVALVYPMNGSWTNQRNVTFNYTLTEDNPDECWLYVNISNKWTSVVNNTDPVNGNNNLTINLSDGTYIWNVWCNDTLGFSAFNESNITIYVDTIAPNITNQNRTPSTVYFNSTLNLNATVVDDRNVSVVWVEGNWSGDWANNTNTTNTGTGYNISINASVLSNQEVIGWRFYSNDSAGNVNNGSLQVFIVENIGTPNAPNLTSPTNGSSVVFDNVLFEWVKPFDPDNDNRTYELWVSRDTGFTDIDANITNINNSLSYNTKGSPYNLTKGVRYWRVRAKDPVNYSNYSAYWEIRVVEAIINITSPLNNTLVYPGDTVTINVDEVRTGAWVDNVTLEILAVNYTATGNPSWTYDYTIPDIVPNVVNITAIGFNQTTNETVTNSIEIRLSKSDATVPVINSVCSNETHMYQNNNSRITIISSLDTLAEKINLTIVTPSDNRFELNLTSSSKSNLTYTHNYEYKLEETGNYSLIANITDVENQTRNLNYTITSYADNAATDEFNLTTIGVSSIRILDVCGGNILYTNQTANMNLTILSGSDYDVRFDTAGPVVTFEEVEFNGTYEFALNYTDLAKSIAAPSGKRVVVEFELTSNLTGQKNVSVVYNYSSIASALDDENGLVMYKCDSQSSCDWEEVSTILDTTTNIITGETRNTSVFLIAETATTTNTISTTVTSTVGGGGGVSIKNRTLPVGLELVSEEPFQMFANDQMSIEIVARNVGKVTLHNIRLNAESNSSNVEVRLENDFIEKLSGGEEELVPLLVTTKREEGRYKIRVTADVESPELDASTEIFFDIVKRGYINRTVILTRVQFAKDLFKENPECLELEEVLKNAEDALEREDFSEANKLMESAVQSCRDLIASKEEKYDWLPSPLRGISLNEWLVFAIEIVVILVVVGLVVRYYRRKRLLGL